MPEVVIQASVGETQIAFTEIVKDDLEAINDRLDRYNRAIGRQRAKVELAQKLGEIEASNALLNSWEERRSAAMQVRIESRAALVARWQAEHEHRQAGGRRASEFRVSTQQRAALDQHDKETRDEQDKFDREKASVERNRPIIEAQISRMRAVIAGRDPTDLLLEVTGGAADAA